MPFENEMYLSKDPGSYMAMAVYLQNPWSGCLLFPAPQNQQSSQSWMHDASPPNPLQPLSSVVVSTQAYTCTFRREITFENEIYFYPINLGHVVSENIWLWWSISKTPGMVACFCLQLREEDAI